MINPYLIQRIYCLDDPKGGKGIDQFHEFKYMGSAEFELGTLPDNLKLMRRYRDEMSVHAIDCTPIDPETPLFYVGREQDVELCALVLQADHTGEPIPLKEGLWMNHALKDPERERLNGWWAIQSNLGAFPSDDWVPFAFFLNERHAKKWLELL